MDIINKEIRKNPLMHRDEIEMTIRFEKMPSRLEIRDFLSKNYKVDKENIKIKKIVTKFGEKEALVLALIYESRDWLHKFEIIKKKDKEAESKKSKEEKSEEQKGKQVDEPRTENNQ